MSGIDRRLDELGVFLPAAAAPLAIASAPGFTGQAGVMNGASDLIAVFGDKGRHARTTIAVAGLPLGGAVEVEAVCEVEPLPLGR